MSWKGNTGIAGASVVEGRGQWVKIVGPQAQEAARTFAGGSDLLAGRIVADYAIMAGKALLIHGGDGGMKQALQRGMAEWTELEITALYPKEEIAEQARQRLQKEKLDHRITCRVGSIEQLPFEAQSFDMFTGLCPVTHCPRGSDAGRLAGLPVGNCDLHAPLALQLLRQNRIWCGDFLNWPKIGRSAAIQVLSARGGTGNLQEPRIRSTLAFCRTTSP